MAKLYYDDRRWVVPGKQGRAAVRVDIPSNPDALAAWLSEHDVRPGVADYYPPDAPAAPGEAPDAGAASAIQRGADAVAAWLFDIATQAQVEAVFAALGCRWGEARR
jgi:hypothetical protein